MSSRAQVLACCEDSTSAPGSSWATEMLKGALYFEIYPFRYHSTQIIAFNLSNIHT